MREDLPLREINIEQIWAEVQVLRKELETHNHLDIGNAQLLTGEMNGILQSPNFVSGSSGCQINFAAGTVEFNSGTFRGDILIGVIGGVRTEITGNDIYLYDDTTGGTDPGNKVITGSAANIYFPRTDDATQRFVIRKRSSFQNDDDNVLEMFFDKDANNSRYNYIFNGRTGNQLASEGHLTYNIHSTLDRFDIGHGNSDAIQFFMCKSDTPTDANWGNGLAGGIRTMYIFQDMGTAIVFSDSPDFTLGEVVSGGTSGFSGYVGTKTDINNYIIVGADGPFTVGETITGATSLNSGVLDSLTATTFNPATFAGGGVLLFGHNAIYAGSTVLLAQMWLDAYKIWVSSDIVPYADNSYSLGSPTKEFKDIYIDGKAYIDEFGEFPLTPSSAPTTNYQVTNKKYVDDSIGAGAGETFGSGKDGDLASGFGLKTLDRDYYYHNVTLGSGDTINTNGYRLFVKGTLTVGSGGRVHRHGNNGSVGGNGANATSGGAGVAGAGGVGGTALATNTIPGAVAGTTGTVGRNGNSRTTTGLTIGTTGSDGTDGTNQAKSLGSNAGNGNDGGKNISGGDAGADVPVGTSQYAAAQNGSSVAGTGGITTGTVYAVPYGVISAHELRERDGTDFTSSPSSGNSSQGGVGGVAVEATFSNDCRAYGGGSGGGGGGGGSGGIVLIFAKEIIVESGGIIEANGGDGGAGGNAGTCYALATMIGEGAAAAVGGSSGGSGGTGGTGGVIILVYKSLTGTGTIQATGGGYGLGGNKSNGVTDTVGTGVANADYSGWVPNDGQAGEAGAAGVIIKLEV